MSLEKAWKLIPPEQIFRQVFQLPALPCRSEGGRHGDEFNLMEGPEYQAEIPVCRPKPPPGSEPTPQEAEWVEGLVMERGHFGGTGEPIRLVELQPGRG